MLLDWNISRCLQGAVAYLFRTFHSRIDRRNVHEDNNALAVLRMPFREVSLSFAYLHHRPP